MRVLIADDDAVIRLGLRTMLQDAGHEVVGAASSGSATVALAVSTESDAIILDIEMARWTDWRRRGRSWRGVRRRS
jgi:DNA-binding NarL/FixJ family response regulator